MVLPKDIPPSADTPLIAAQAAELSKRTGRKFVIWLQLGITNADAQKIAHANDLGFVEDKCLKIEHQKSKQRNGGR
jgi:predicted CoA-binding protein